MQTIETSSLLVELNEEEAAAVQGGFFFNIPFFTGRFGTNQKDLDNYASISVFQAGNVVGVSGFTASGLPGLPPFSNVAGEDPTAPTNLSLQFLF